jgi:hypothetical protein
MGKIDGNQLYKNKTFKNGFRKKMDHLLSTLDFKKYGLEYQYEYYGDVNPKIGVLQKTKWGLQWSWMNTINTNYTCYELIIDAVNLLIKNEIVKRVKFFTFDGTNDTNKELNDLFEILELYKEDFFTAKHKKNKTSLFNKMRFATQFIWYKSCLSEIFFLENIDHYFDNISGHTLCFERGSDDDMKNGKDFYVIINREFKSFQHKKDTLKYCDGDYYCFEKMNYDKENYKTVDYIAISIGTIKNYLFKNSDDEKLCGMRKLDDGKNYFLIHESLLVKPKPEKKHTTMTLTENLHELLKFTCEKQIPFHMKRDENVINSIEIVEGDELTIYVVYSDLEDDEFPKKVIDTLNDLKERFK